MNSSGDCLPRFALDDCVEVDRRFARDGGIATVTAVNGDGTYNVKYQIGGREKNLKQEALRKLSRG